MLAVFHTSTLLLLALHSASFINVTINVHVVYCATRMSQLYWTCSTIGSALVKPSSLKSRCTALIIKNSLSWTQGCVPFSNWERFNWRSFSIKIPWKPSLRDGSSQRNLDILIEKTVRSVKHRLIGKGKTAPDSAGLPLHDKGCVPKFWDTWFY